MACAMADAGTNTGKSDGGKTCAKAFVHCGILKPVKAGIGVATKPAFVRSISLAAI